MKELTYARASELLRYDANSGRLYWCVSRGTAKAGDEAGFDRKLPRQRTSYRIIKIDGAHYMAHRIAYLLHHGKWPAHGIDHVDGDGLNNRPGNMRDVPQSTNNRNARMRRDNASGVCGVHWHKATNKWAAGVSVDGKNQHLGLFTDLAEAESAVREYRAKNGYTERHGKAI